VLLSSKEVKIKSISSFPNPNFAFLSNSFKLFLSIGSTLSGITFLSVDLFPLAVGF